MLSGNNNKSHMFGKAIFSSNRTQQRNADEKKYNKDEIEKELAVVQHLLYVVFN